jgi:hypothetical protein
MLIPIIVEDIFPTSIRIQTWHQSLPIISVHYRLLNQCTEMQNERFMKLGLATKLSSVPRQKNLPIQELHTMIFKT